MIYRSDNLTVDTDLFRVARDDQPVEIEPQVFDLLIYLIENRNRVVTRSELLDTLWHGRVVSDSALSARLKAARKSVGDSGSVQNIIKTIHGRGYQFIAEVAEQATSEPGSHNETSSVHQRALPLPDRPSIAILPFTNLSGDPAQEYFTDGLTEDIITELSRFRDLFVIASNSSFAYKNKSPRIQDVSRDLGVRYVLEGSVQKSNSRVRISVQLIDGLTGQHLWAERYDRQLEDIFEVQDEVTETIVGTLASGYGGRLRKAWQSQAHGTRPESVQAFDCFMRGLDFVDCFTKDNIQRGRELFEQAVTLDPGYAKAYGKLAWTYILDAVEGWGDDYENSMAKGLKFATMGIRHDDGESWAHWALAACYIYGGRHDLGTSEFEKAVELNPNDADVLADFGYYLGYLGDAEKGLVFAHKAMRLNPHFPDYYQWQLGQIYHDARKYLDAVAAFESLRSIETPTALLYLAASHAALGHGSEARNALDKFRNADPKATLRKWTEAKLAPYKNRKDLEHFRKNLRRAGLKD